MDCPIPPSGNLPTVPTHLKSWISEQKYSVSAFIKTSFWSELIKPCLGLLDHIECSSCLKGVRPANSLKLQRWWLLWMTNFGTYEHKRRKRFPSLRPSQWGEISTAKMAESKDSLARDSTAPVRACPNARVVLWTIAAESYTTIFFLRAAHIYHSVCLTRPDALAGFERGCRGSGFRPAPRVMWLATLSPWAFLASRAQLQLMSAG